VQLSFIKNGLFTWATVPDPKQSLMVIDFDQNLVSIVQTHDYTIVNMLGVMTHEIQVIIFYCASKLLELVKYCR
jgi:hypothetical protein